jgi:low temperature requirement protein LtrA
VGIVAALGTLIAIALWWVYFDSISHRLPLANNLAVSAWFYLHLPLTMGIAAVGASVLNVVEHAGEHLPPEVRWLLVGAIAVVLTSITLLIRTVQLTPVEQQTLRVGGWFTLLSGVFIALLGFTNLEILPFLLILVLLMLVPIFTAIRTWLAAIEEEH